MSMDMFIKLGDIKGESKDKVHVGKTDVLAWSWAMSNSGTAHMGGGAGSGKVSVNDLTFTKYVDVGSPDLISACATGKHIPTIELIIRKAGGTPLEYILITLTQCLVTSVSTGGSGGEDRLTENVALNFAKFKFVYVEQDDKGAAKAKPEVTYNIAQNVKE